VSGLADVVLLVHALFVVFVVGGLAFIWIGALCGWRGVRSFPFRILHLAAILLVCAEALIGVACPLTAWEDQLRASPAQSDFVARWLHRILYYDFPGWVFLTLYLLFALAVAVSFVLIRPSRDDDQK
jgi:hypothetical protein